MNQNQIIEIQKKIGAEPDGFFGRDSRAKLQKHLRSLMPAVNPWPKTDQASLTEFYGRPGDESQLINLPVVGLGIKYEGRDVQTIRCHRRVGDSLKRVLAELAGSEPWLLKSYEGCYANRPMRGGSTPSLHARGAAIDFDAEHNGNFTIWPDKATMPLQILEIFSKEGWLSAGAFWSRDAMHFQATQ